ncbi:hypothetical protein [Polynucleobacter antarcticus]|uniref:hypothetical protein n=1 Tax=Polynucleobacter antarcticus TaxID=1743162 RepID=UPI00156DBCD5|nr:hypothetical protein [Polynucleobacter antarcticus]
MNSPIPIIAIELILVFGGMVLFAWWQFRDLRKEREKRKKLPTPTLDTSDSEKP